ncbi:MAG: PhnD/SsuA/transferrin family substrate-binding protein [Kofleriaceae bacterium]|nr:PhnD/SsuA/transferrin family substrate-binding protein [Kofleriaceae bacterium]
MTPSLARLGLAVATVAAALVIAAAPARADDTITVGMYAPTAPFDSTGDRNTFIKALADHLAGATDGATVKGRVYGSAGAFATAIKKGEIQFALVDAPYAAALGLPYRILAAAVRDGDATVAWQVVASSKLKRLSDLAGKRLAVPAIGAKQNAFVTNALLGGEVEASYFGKIVEAADAHSAVTLISVGKADAALVPGGIDLPAGVSRVLDLRQVGWPMLVAAPGVDAALAQKIATRARSFKGTGAFTGFTSADAGKYKALAGSFGKPRRRGPMAVPPPARLAVRDLLAGRVFDVPLSDVLSLVETPPPVPAPAPAP